MAKKIIEMVNAKQAELQGHSDLAEEFAALAVAAISDGVKSRAWATYMRQFVEKDPNDNTKALDPAQLARLLAEDGTLGDSVLDRKRGYIVGNAMCGAGSPDTRGLARLVDSIDQGLAGDCGEEANPAANSGVEASGQPATPATGEQGGTTAESPKRADAPATN